MTTFEMNALGDLVDVNDFNKKYAGKFQIARKVETINNEDLYRVLFIDEVKRGNTNIETLWEHPGLPCVIHHTRTNHAGLANKVIKAII